jgi:quercetin dioxygenase-like cupin family protein
MAGYAVKKIDDMEAAYRGGFKRARAELGVEAFGLQVLDFPPSNTQYPEHDHTHDGQEEVYVPMRGTGEIEIEDERYALEPGVMVRVGPGVKRKLLSGEDGMRVLAIGGVPGKPYEPGELSQLGTPDPMAQR